MLPFGTDIVCQPVEGAARRAMRTNKRDSPSSKKGTQTGRCDEAHDVRLVMLSPSLVNKTDLSTL